MISADMYGAIEVLGEIPPKIPVRQLATKVGSIFDNPEFQMSQLTVFEEVIRSPKPWSRKNYN